MEPYTDLAPVYDAILSHVDYDRWYHYLRTLMLRYVESPGLILELGCGTGKFGAKFSRDDFPIYGMDNSLQMLKMAKARAFKDFRIFCGDMTRFYLSGRFDFVFSVHDTMNYLLDYTSIRRALRSVRAVLSRNGVFMFDITTEHNIRRYFEGKTMRYSVQGTEIEWDNSYDRRKRIIRSTLDFRKPNGETTSEEHLQRIYTVGEIKKLLDRERFRIIDIFGDYGFDPPGKETVMINFVTRKD